MAWPRYNLDNWHGMDRYHYNAEISAQDWADTYSIPFQAAVVGANASGLMCSYNAMTLPGYPSSGVPTCADPKLLTELARGTFGFDGYITGESSARGAPTTDMPCRWLRGADGYSPKLRTVGDCGAAQDVWSAHHFGGDAAGATAAAVAAGMDVDCGSFVKKNGMGALKSGQLSEEALDRAVGHLFKLRIRLGYFDPAGSTPWGNARYDSLMMRCG
jgi:beta-D-xylosidase 4